MFNPSGQGSPAVFQESDLMEMLMLAYEAIWGRKIVWPRWEASIEWDV